MKLEGYKKDGDIMISLCDTDINVIYAVLVKHCRKNNPVEQAVLEDLHSIIEEIDKEE